MTKLNIDYWVGKFDKVTEVDLAAIHDGLQTLDEHDGQLLAEIILGGAKMFKNPEEYSKAYEVCLNFNHDHMVEPLFYTPGRGIITVWRYDYRQFLKVIPDELIIKAVTAIYERIGYQLEKQDLQKITYSNNIYEYFLSSLKEEVRDRYIFVDSKQDMAQYLDATYLNLYLLFDKLGLEGRNFFEVMASIGEISVPVSKYRFETGTRVFYEMKAEAVDRSRGRVYPTFYELSVVTEL